jgi:hypothetical protein
MAAAHLVPYKDEDSGGEDRIADPGIEAGPGELGLAQADSTRRLGIGRAAAGGEVAECGRGGPERHGPCSRLVSVGLSSAPTCALSLRRERHESGHCSRPVVRARRRRAGEGRGSPRSTGSVCGPRSRSGGFRPSTGLRLEDEHAADQSDRSAATGRRTVVVVAGTVRSTCRLPPSSSTARAAWRGTRPPVREGVCRVVRAPRGSPSFYGPTTSTTNKLATEQFKSLRPTPIES